MDRLTTVHQKKATKTTKKKPIKVVYIANPMKVKTSASEFRALVQELTGQYAELPDPTRFPVDSLDDDDDDHDHHDVGGGNQMVPDGLKIAAVNDHAVDEVPRVDPGSVGPKRPDLAFEPFDEDVFTPQMIENFTGFLPSCLLYESAV